VSQARPEGTPSQAALLSPGSPASPLPAAAAATGGTVATVPSSLPTSPSAASQDVSTPDFMPFEGASSRQYPAAAAQQHQPAHALAPGEAPRHAGEGKALEAESAAPGSSVWEGERRRLTPPASSGPGAARRNLLRPPLPPLSVSPSRLPLLPPPRRSPWSTRRTPWCPTWRSSTCRSCTGATRRSGASCARPQQGT